MSPLAQPIPTAQKPKNTKKKRKNTALIICHDGAQFWTTQNQFWQWLRDLKIVKIQDRPLTGKFVRPYEELMVVLGTTVLNLAHKNHLNEALLSRRYRKPK